MEKLQFERTKYGKELLIDACNESELVIVADTMVLNFYTLIFLEKGNGVYHLDTETIHFEDNLVLFVKPGQINKVDKVIFEKCIMLFFEGDFLDEFFNDKDFILKFAYFHNPELPSFVKLDEAQFQTLNNFAMELRAEIHAQTIDSIHILRSIIYYLLVRLNQAYAKVYGITQQTLQNPTVLAFLKLLEKNIKKQKSVESFANDLQISRVQLNSLCQKYFSKTATQIIRERTITEIKKALKYDVKSFSEIAYEYNFSAPSHFSRFVKQMTGKSPQEFKDDLSNW
ncbi:MAG: helix-turn-helix transcriptional regulator [Chitinophagales bacterium]|jgi:AraC family transcriptional activator of pobA|nr:helix-turn-helix transcriptional regulator [Chitinophagales bacterium]